MPTGPHDEAPAALQETLPGRKVRCNTCCRRCVLGEGESGWCSTRRVRNRKLYTLTYGHVSSLSANPVEKKPFHHFYAGSFALTAGSWGCNFACPWCQNWEVSKRVVAGGRFMRPEAFVAEAVAQGCQGTSISFNEPTLSLEWAAEVFPLARREKGLFYNTFVTNGYMTPEALRLLADAGLDAMNVDMKGGDVVYRRYCRAEAEHVWRSCVLARELGLHIELTTLVIPGVNDDEYQLRQIARRIAADLGAETPWHLTAYYPAYHFKAVSTAPAKLLALQSIVQSEGLRFVYTGNIPGSGNNTYCPACGSLVVERSMLQMTACRVTPAGRCPDCGGEIAGRGWGWAGR